MIKNALLAAFAALSANAADAPKTMVDASFECRVPAGWLSDSQPGGVVLLGPRGSGQVTPQISVRWISPDSPTHKSADAYLERLVKPSSIAVPGWKTGPVTETTVAGRKARRVERDVSEFVPPSSMNTKEVPMKEIHIVVPAKTGFYAVVYYVPAALDKKGRSALVSVLKSFKPKL